MSSQPDRHDIPRRHAGASSEAELQAAEQTIRQARAARTRALAEGDHELAAGLWAADVTVRRAPGHAGGDAVSGRLNLEAGAAGMSPTRPPVHGSEAVTAMVSPDRVHRPT